jgi:hypothetical protein
MKTEINSQEDSKWQALLARSKPTFAGDTDLPFGFLTSTLARIKNEKRDREILERIGLRSLFAAMAILVAVVGVSIGVQIQNRFDFDPAVKSLLQVDDVPIS